MFAFDISPDLTNRKSAAIDRLQQLCNEKEIEINRVTFFFEEERKFSYKIDLYLLQIELIDKTQKQDVKDYKAIQEEYADRLEQLKTAYIEANRHQMSNKDKPYLFEDGEIIELTPETREKRLKRLSELEVPMLIDEVGSLDINSQTDLSELKKKLQKKSSYYIEQTALLQKVRADLATPLMEEKQERTNELLEARRRIDARIKNSLYGCCLFGSPEEVSALIASLGSFQSKNNYVNQIVDEANNRPLHTICLRDDATAVEIATILLDAGANITLLNKHSYDPLHTALRAHKLDLVQRLLKKDNKNSYLHNPDLTQTGEYNRTILHTCAFHGYLHILESLPRIVIYALINAKTKGDAQETTALHIASEKGYAETVEFLIRFGGDHTITNKAGETAIMVAIIAGRVDVAILFFNQGRWITAEQQHQLLNNKIYKKQQVTIAATLKKVSQLQIESCDAILSGDLEQKFLDKKLSYEEATAKQQELLSKLPDSEKYSDYHILTYFSEEILNKNDLHYLIKSELYKTTRELKHLHEQSSGLQKQLLQIASNAQEELAPNTQLLVTLANQKHTVKVEHVAGDGWCTLRACCIDNESKFDPKAMLEDLKKHVLTNRKIRAYIRDSIYNNYDAAISLGGEFKLEEKDDNGNIIASKLSEFYQRRQLSIQEKRELAELEYKAYLEQPEVQKAYIDYLMKDGYADIRIAAACLAREGKQLAVFAAYQKNGMLANLSEDNVNPKDPKTVCLIFYPNQRARAAHYNRLKIGMPVVEQQLVAKGKSDINLSISQGPLIGVFSEQKHEGKMMGTEANRPAINPEEANSTMGNTH